MAEGWRERAASALVEGGDEEVEVLRPERPPLFDSEGVRAVMAPFLAALVWAGAVFREIVADSPIDPAALLMRAVALGFTVRAALAGRRFVGRLGLWAAADRWGLALAPEGLLLRTPRGDVAVAREDVLGVREHGHWGEQSAERRWSGVYVVTYPDTGRLFVAIPPVFERSPGVLAERLMRWLGPRSVDDGPTEHPAPARLASKLYDDAAEGRVPEGVTVIRHGAAWLARGPYATILLGVVIVEGFLRLGPDAWSRMGVVLPAAVALSLVAVPLVWGWLTRRAIAPRKGIALLFTPAEMLMRTRAGVVRATWKGLAQLRLEGKPTWSILSGYHQARTLVIERRDDPVIRYDEAFLGVPAEVVIVLANAYRKALIPRPGPDRASGAPG